MAVTEANQHWLLARYRANWLPLTKSNGLEAYTKWWDGMSTDETAVIQAFEDICKERSDKDQYDIRHTPKLLEWQARVYRIVKARGHDENAEHMKHDCGYCENKGRRYLVLHTPGSKSHERIITAVPDYPLILRFVYVGSVPCTCPRGQMLMRHADSLQKDVTRMGNDRWSEALKKSFSWSEAANLEAEYSRHRNHKYYGKPLEGENDPVFTAMLQKLVDRMVKGEVPIEPPKRARKPEEDLVGDVLQNYDEEIPL